MLSSKTGGFFMQYKVYSAEYKISLIEEYQSRDISMRAFCKEKDLCLSTLESWLRKIRLYGQPGIKMLPKANNNTVVPLDVTNETRAIINEESRNISNTFTLKTKGMTLTFSINNLKDVLEVINND